MKSISRERYSIDRGWRFHLGDAANYIQDFGFGHGSSFTKSGEGVGPIAPDFDDADWQSVTIPHDWVVSLLFDPVGGKEQADHGFKPVGRSKPETAIGWYRLRFELPAEDEGRRLSVEFDGIFRDSMVWLNGHYLGRQASGYTGFQYDITDAAHYGEENVLTVRADASHYEGWWYEGGGIYRHAWLVKTQPLHVVQWGTAVTSTLSDDTAKVTICTRIVNESEEAMGCIVHSEIVDSSGQVVASAREAITSIQSCELREITQIVSIAQPELWSLENPHLYKLITTVLQGESEVDKYETPFGIRTMRFDPNEGFFLNDEPVKLKGVCCHQDHAGVGTALPDRLQAYRIERLKSMGCNAYRSAHNPPTPELLDACDRLGMLVIDETRQMGSTPEILGQLKSMVLRDRNHPCVVLWSLGNEEHTIQNTPVGTRITTAMQRLVKHLDPTRLTTYAGNNGGDYQGNNSVVDVRGWNYMNIGKNMDQYHNEHPEQPILGSEEASTLCTRGIYTKDEENAYVSAYDENVPEWGSSAEGWWSFYAERPYLAGGFVWTGFDYRGETYPYEWPCINSHFGIMDTCGFPKDNYYYYQAWWTGQPVLHLFPHWNWPGGEGEEIDVRCFGNCGEVELLLNGKSLGTQMMPHNGSLRWKVPYTPGILEARGSTDGTPIKATCVETTGGPYAICLEPDRTTLNADGEDIYIVNISVRDDEGRVVPVADNNIQFVVSENSVILGVGNGNPSSHESDTAHTRRAFNGWCQVIVQTSENPGSITLTATSPGLQPAQVVLRAEVNPESKRLQMSG